MLQKSLEVHLAPPEISYTPYYYSMGELILCTEISIPGLNVISPQEILNQELISVHFGTVSEQGLENPTQKGFTYQRNATDFWLAIPSIARFLVSQGKSITIDPTKGIDEDSLRVFLFSTCFEILLRQRQIIVLPGFAFHYQQYAIAFLGNTDAGLSVLQKLFFTENYSFLANNFFTLTAQGMTLPGFAHMEFWFPVADSLNLPKDTLKILRPGVKKYLLAPSESSPKYSLPLRFLYTLKQHKHPDLAFTTIDQTQKAHYLQSLPESNTLSAYCWPNSPIPAEVLNNLQIICLHLPGSGLTLHQLIDVLKNDFIERGACHVHY